jgi:DNA-binding transcriptional ArsR family regulator
MSDADRADGFRGLSHPVRRKVLNLLAKGDCPVSTLHEAIAVSQPVLSRHLSVLRETGLVEDRKAGQQRIYRLRRGAVRKLAKWLQQLDA